MKGLSYVWVFFHAIYVILFMWAAPYLIYFQFDHCPLSKMTAWWLCLMVGQYIHWLLLKYECIFSLMEKKTEDPSYVMGSDPSKSCLWETFSRLTCNRITEKDWKRFHFEFTKMNILIGIGFITLGNECFVQHKEIKIITFIILSHALNEYLTSQRNKNYK